MNVLLTGATGFLGEYIFARLLERGHTVWAHYRSESKRVDTLRFLSRSGLPFSARNLHWFKGDLLRADLEWDSWVRKNKGLSCVDTLFHCAASTRFHLDREGEPVKTNVGTSLALRRLSDRRPMDVHLVSTAFVCGMVHNHVVCEENHPRGQFLNVYEESKWEAEQIWNGRATILRPGIVIGDSENGRCRAFTGYYVFLQAMHLLDQLLEHAPSSYRNNLGLVAPVDPDGRANIIPVDYVAAAAVKIVEDPKNHGKIYHLTHPNPPTNGCSVERVCRRFGLNGIRCAGVSAQLTTPRNVVERMVLKQMDVVRSYFTNNPVFDRSNTDRALRDLEVPPIDDALWDKLLTYAIRRNWS